MHFLPESPNNGWTHHKDGPHMQLTTLTNGDAQEFHFANDHPQYPGFFKEMEQIIREWGLWPESGNLLAQCEGFKCKAGRMDCCCCHLLFNLSTRGLSWKSL